MSQHAVSLGEPVQTESDGSSRSAYVDVDKVIELAKGAGADALWPGWGFLAESADLAEACESSGITFIGPSATAMRLVGAKDQAKRLAVEQGVPVIPWSEGLLTDLDDARRQAERVGYPLLIKAVAGGGGRGIRRVDGPEDMAGALSTARAEAATSFGSPDLILEHYVHDARHVEVQLIADRYETVWALGTRDCSLQRRHQKLVEEAPAPGIDPEVEQAMCRAAARVGLACGYVGAGTIEYLYEPATDRFFFLEMNTRLQVEHPVTETVYGIDLVIKQLDVARGEALPATPPTPRGASVEVRLNAEDPDNDFAPSSGRILSFRPPQGPGIRVDAGFVKGDDVPAEFDSNVAKLIAWGADRSEAVARISTALSETSLALSGGPCNRTLLMELLGHPEVREGPQSTQWLEAYLRTRPPSERRPHLFIALAAAAIADARAHRRREVLNFLATARTGFPRHVPDPEPLPLRYMLGSASVSAEVAVLGPSRYRVTIEGGSALLEAEHLDDQTMLIQLGRRQHRVLLVATAAMVFVEVDGISHRLRRVSDGRVIAQIPAAVTLVHVEAGQRVAAGDKLLTLEVMKMETAVTAPVAGTVREVLAQKSSKVGAGDLLVTIDDEGAAAESGPSLAVEPPAQAGPAGDALAALWRATLGYDMQPGELEEALAQVDSGHTRSRTRLVELLNVHSTLRSVFTARVSRGGEGPAPAEELETFLRQLDPDDDRLSEGFRKNLRDVLALYGVSEGGRSFDLESALLRLFQGRQAHERSGDRIILTLARALMGLAPPRTAAGRDRIRVSLERLADQLVDESPRLAQAVWNALHEICDLPWLQEQREQASGRVVDLLGGDLDQPDEVERALAACPVGVLSALIAPLRSLGAGAWKPVLSELARRFYGADAKLRGPERDGPAQLHVGVGERSCRLIWDPDPGELEALFSTLPDGVEVDLLSETEPTPEQASLARRSPASRCTWLWGSSSYDLRARTFARAAAGDDDAPDGAAAPLVEEPLLDDLHPCGGVAAEVDRLENFDLTRIPARGGFFVAAGRSRDGSGDDRLFVIAEVEQEDPPLLDPRGDVRLPAFESVFLEAVQAMRRARDTTAGADSMVWNRLVIVYRPLLDVSTEQMQRLAERLSVQTVGLGVERVVIRARVRRAGRSPRDMVIEWSSPAGRGAVVDLVLPRNRPVPVLSRYERRVVEARRRGKFYPYELVRTLTTRGSLGGLAEGEFEELDLDPETTRLVSVHPRPFGENTANLVVGRISNVSERFKDGLIRILVIGDPTKKMGALAEPECRRIIAAVDLAEEIGVPVEWVPVSSGAKIAMDSGTENLDWTARVVRRLVTFTQAGGVVNIVVDGVCVGAQSYWNAEATMLNHCRGTLVMTSQGCMLLTGKRALEYSGSVSAPTNVGIGGLAEIMGPNGQAQYAADNIRDAYRTLFRHYDLTYVPPGLSCAPAVPSSDPVDRDVGSAPYRGEGGFHSISEIFCDATNPGRKRPFDIRQVMHAVVDEDVGLLERWDTWEGGETAVVAHAQLGGQPVCLVGIESRPISRRGFVSARGPESWASGTLFPQSSRKVARAINAASGVVPVVVLANLSGFDGSPESLRSWQLEYGAEIARAVVNFRGPIFFCVMARYHGGAYVVFSQTLSDSLEAIALDGAYASVIGGGPAAAIVLTREVWRRVKKDPRVQEAQRALQAADPDRKGVEEAEAQRVWREVEAEHQAALAQEFDAVHSVQRAMDVGSLSDVIPLSGLREMLCRRVRERVQGDRQPRTPEPAPKP